MTSRLEDLIAELCPNGVEYKKIGDIADYEQPTKYIVKSTKYDDSFATPVLTAGQSFILGYTDELDNIYLASKDNPVIIFDDFTGAIQWVDFPFKVKSSAMKMITAKPNVLIRYLYHWMALLGFSSSEHKRLWISTYSNFEIPVPPLEVQAEIVRILDTFTELTAELTAELTDRKKQYEYYRDTLLTFNDNNPLHSLIQRYCPNGVEYKALEYVASYSKNRIDSQILDEHNYVGVENLLQNKQGKTLANSIPKESKAICFSIGDVLIGNIRPYLKKIWFADCVGGTNGDVLVIHIHDKNVISPRFLYHILSSERFFLYDVRNSKGAKMPRGDKKAVMQFEIPVPPLDVQHQIVQILDRFDALCNDLTQGLPAEIEARRKQYEYYRDLLLTFKRA